MNLREVVGSGASGAFATGVDVAALVLLVKHGTAVPAAAFVGACAGAVTNFVLNKYVAFRDRSRITGHQLARFGVVAVVAALLLAGLMEILAVKLHVPFLLAKLVCAIVVFAGWTFPAQRHVFRRRSGKETHAYV